MTGEKRSNFEKMAENSRHLFLEYDRDALAGKYGTAYDREFFYIDLLSRRFRIERATGLVYLAGENKWFPAGPAETMIFYDIFCYGDTSAKASFDYINHGSLVGRISATGDPGKDMYFRHVRRFTGHVPELKQACEALHGIPLQKGDVCCEIPLFSFMNCRFLFWEADDEFPAQITVFFDKSILKFMHFETTWYVSEYLLDRIGSLAGI